MGKTNYSYNTLIVKKYSQLEKIESDLQDKLHEKGLEKQSKISKILYLQDRLGRGDG